MEKDNEAAAEEHKELSRAALQLTVLMYAKIEPKTLNPILRDIKPKIKTKPTSSSSFPVDPQTLRLLTDHIPPLRPVIRGFPQTLIGDCTEPYVKQLTVSDVRANQARVTLSNDYANNGILPLLKGHENFVDGIPVTAYDAGGKEFPMTLRRWSDRFHVLTSGWKPFAEAQDLVSHQDFVTVWVFRRVDTGKLCVAIASRRLPVYSRIPKIIRRCRRLPESN